MINGWALLGGGLLLLVAAMNVLSVLGGIFWKPFSGDFDLTQVGVVVAAFSFLPYCQLHGKNVTADIFTAKAPPFLIKIFALLASVIAFLFACFLTWRMYEGMLNQKEYGYTTAIVQFPVWTAFIPILFSLALLAAAAFITLLDDCAALKKTNGHD